MINVWTAAFQKAPVMGVSEDQRRRKGMSEVKGALLGIVLAISAFAIIFSAMTIAMRSASETVSERMEQAAETDPFGAVVAYTLP